VTAPREHRPTGRRPAVSVVTDDSGESVYRLRGSAGLWVAVFVVVSRFGGGRRRPDRHRDRSSRVPAVLSRS
jgi:hypothetical protein